MRFPCWLPLLLVTAAIPTILSCSEKHRPPEPAAAEAGPSAPASMRPAAVSVGTPCRQQMVTSGMGLRWKRVNHRISRWEISPQTPADCSAASNPEFSLRVGCMGGNWSTGQTMKDTPILDYRYFVVNSKYAAFLPVNVELTIEAPSPEAEREVSLSLREHGLAGFSAYEVLLNGLALDTDVPQTSPAYPAQYDPALGYTTRGIGAAVHGLSVERGMARFTVRARFELGTADRFRMNRAVRCAQTRATVQALLVGLRAGHVTALERRLVIRHPRPWVLLQPEYEPTSATERRLELAGEPGYAEAFLGLREFAFRLFAPDGKADYLRELSVQAEILGYEPDTGRTVVDLNGYASNVGLLTYRTMINRFSARLALVQLPGGEVRAGRKTLEFPVGTTALPLP